MQTVSVSALTVPVALLWRAAVLACALAAVFAVAPSSASAQRLDPNLLLSWELVPVVSTPPSPNGGFAILTSERLSLFGDGRLSYRRRDSRDPTRDRAGTASLSAAEVEQLATTLRAFCALSAPEHPRTPGDVHVELQFADHRACELSIAAGKWRTGAARRFSSLVDRLIARALRGAASPVAGH